MNIKEDFYVIGVGLPRTGTLSTKAALEMILPGKCTHMITDTVNYVNEWTRICDNEMNDDELKHFLLSNGFTAGVDVPFIFLYERLMKIFPNAKVLLTVRDPTDWAESMRTTVCVAHQYVKTFPANIVHWLRPLTKYLKHNTVMPWNAEKFKEFRDMLRACSKRKGGGEELFLQWTERIKATVPQEKLLIFNVAEGWTPLCNFLDVPIPDSPFPNVNNKIEFNERLENIKYEGWKAIIQIIVVFAVIFMSYLLYF